MAASAKAKSARSDKPQAEPQDNNGLRTWEVLSGLHQEDKKLYAKRGTQKSDGSYYPHLVKTKRDLSRFNDPIGSTVGPKFLLISGSGVSLAHVQSAQQELEVKNRELKRRLAEQEQEIAALRRGREDGVVPVGAELPSGPLGAAGPISGEGTGED